MDALARSNSSRYTNRAESFSVVSSRNLGYIRYGGRRLAHTTMSGMIANPKCRGYHVGNKVKVIDMFTKKQKFLPPEEWVMSKNETGEIVPAIVSEELWNAANAILKRRNTEALI